MADDFGSGGGDVKKIANSVVSPAPGSSYVVPKKWQKNKAVSLVTDPTKTVTGSSLLKS